MFMLLPIFKKIKNEKYYLNPEKYSNNIHILVTKNFGVYNIGIEFKSFQNIKSHIDNLTKINKNLIINEYNQITFKRELNDYNYKNIENMIREIFKYFYFDESINSDSIVTIEVSHEGSMSHGVGYYKDFI